MRALMQYSFRALITCLVALMLVPLTVRKNGRPLSTSIMSQRYVSLQRGGVLLFFQDRGPKSQVMHFGLCGTRFSPWIGSTPLKDLHIGLAVKSLPGGNRTLPCQYFTGTTRSSLKCSPVRRLRRVPGMAPSVLDMNCTNSNSAGLRGVSSNPS